MFLNLVKSEGSPSALRNAAVFVATIPHIRKDGKISPLER